jgi:hypothetical protein
MNKYGKILKKNTNGKFELSILYFDNLNFGGNFTKIMKEKYNDGYNQVIINSEIMIDLIEKALFDKWTLLNVNISDPSVDAETLNEIHGIVTSIKADKLNFLNLKSYLDWALDEGSIFIDSLKFAKEIGNTYQVCEVHSVGGNFWTGKRGDVL